MCCVVEADLRNEEIPENEVKEINLLTAQNLIFDVSFFFFDQEKEPVFFKSS